MADRASPTDEPIKTEDVGDEAQRTLTEANMVLPGVLTLFGFQLFAGMNETVRKELSSVELGVFCADMFLLAVGAMLILLPPAFHRQVQPWVVSRRFVDLASRCMTAAMIPLMLCFAMDTYVVVKLNSHRTGLSLLVAGLLLVIFATGWVVYPKLAKAGPPGREAAEALRRHAFAAGHDDRAT